MTIKKNNTLIPPLEIRDKPTFVLDPMEWYQNKHCDLGLMDNWQELLETAELDQHINQFRHTCQAKREHRHKHFCSSCCILFTIQTVMSSSQLQKMNGRRDGSRERMELVQTDIRANSHDSESKIMDEVEVNVGLR